MILDIHNELRCNADPPASNMLKLKWSEEAAEKAQEWANKCVQGHSPTNFKKLTRHRCSENILLTPYKVSWDVVARAWYSEKVDFKYGQGSINGAQTGHYTLLMWATSSEIGCGSAECPNLPNKYNYVCWMCPGGNKPPVHTPYKTGKPCSACPKACDGSLCTNACYWADNFKNCKTFLIGGTCQSDESLISDCPAMCKCTNGEIKEYD
ncbi:cysteine-rich secretory protein 2 [Gastrophryne carolinensis]